MAEESGDELGRVRAGLTSWFARRQPEAEAVELSELSRPGAGVSSETLLFDLRSKREGAWSTQPLVARIAPTKGPQVFPSYDLSLQYRVMEILGKTEVPVPRLFGYEESPDLLGAPFYIMGRVDGSAPVENPPYHVQGWLAEATAEEQAAIWDSGLQEVARINGLDWEALGFGFLDEPARGATPLDQQLDYYEKFFAWILEGGSHPLCEKARHWLEANKPTSEPIALCWGDAKPANMIFEGTRCVAVLDWELVRLGNPTDDLAWYMTLDRCLSEGANLPRLPGFPSREETVARWEELTGRKAAHLEYYEVLATYKFSLMMYRIIGIHKESGVFPVDSDYDVQNLASSTLEKLLPDA